MDKPKEINYAAIDRPPWTLEFAAVWLREMADDPNIRSTQAEDLRSISGFLNREAGKKNDIEPPITPEELDGLKFPEGE